LLTQKSSVPNFATAALTIPAAPSAVRMSAVVPLTGAGSCAWQVTARPSGSRSAASTRAPDVAKAATRLRPTPRAAPVTIATRPVKSKLTSIGVTCP
jgi:hypothetical protein